MILEMNDISFSFTSEQSIIEHLHLSVKEGEFVSILGPSGSGKSTIFHLIGGLYQPNKGEILLKGKNINGCKGHISYMPQQPALLPWRTVLDNVVLGAELSGKVDKEKAKEQIKKVGLEAYEHALPHELSGGMKQRVAFLRCISSPQSIMCLDEPFSALDELTRLSMQKWLLKVWEEDKRSVLFITHSIEEALLLSDKIYVLSSKPATVIKEITVPFSRPRSEDLLVSNELLQMKKELYHLLKES
ncbi:ATP-binding cassette domain-containing protein [Bacillus massiliigorillae]|uniref:ATP-binding cassette domain-containing protein n=1 Tax=Bacillus massiliigorillae TaxID=1243664 RepID=UPI00039ADB53